MFTNIIFLHAALYSAEFVLDSFLVAVVLLLMRCDRVSDILGALQDGDLCIRYRDQADGSLWCSLILSVTLSLSLSLCECMSFCLHEFLGSSLYFCMGVKKVAHECPGEGAGYKQRVLLIYDGIHYGLAVCSAATFPYSFYPSSSSCLSLLLSPFPRVVFA